MRGRISIVHSESFLDGTPLRIRNASNPVGDATSFLGSRGIGDGDTADVTGVRTEDVIFMTNAALVPAGSRSALASGRPGGGKGASPKTRQKRRAP
jgi:hypothetical protein